MTTLSTEIDSKANAAAGPSLLSDEPVTQKPYLTIRPVKGWRALRLQELWEFRDLLIALGMRNVRLVYKQTALGVLWVVLQPLLGAGIFTLVFGLLADMPTEGSVPYFVFSFAGMLAWTLFSSTLNAGGTVMVTNTHLVSKIYFPRLILPLSAAFQPVVNFVVTLGLMAVLLAAYQVVPGPEILLLPIWMALLLMLALGVSFFCSAVMVYYRDLRYVIPVAVQFLLYASPVGYGLLAVSNRLPPWAQSLYLFNPLASLLEAWRWSLLGSGTLHAGWLAYSAAAAVVVFVAGAYVFRLAEKKFADVI